MLDRAVQMVLQVFTNAGQMDGRHDAKSSQFVRRTDA